MAIPTNIRTLLSGNAVEWARIEFKTTWDPEASLKTITAFANDIDNWGGGYIVLGVNAIEGIPQKPYAGVPKRSLDAWQKDIFEKCKMLRPAYTPIIGTDELDGKSGAPAEIRARIRLRRQWRRKTKNGITLFAKVL